VTEIASEGYLREAQAALKTAAQELLAAANLRRGEILVLGGSTSEVLGERIGKATSLEVGKALLETLLPLAHDAGVFLAVQGCEHLNRALVVERDGQERHDLEVVSAYPWEHAGGGLATAAMRLFRDPVVVESVRAKGAAGIDIGDAFIGMHIRPVGVPVRPSVKAVGAAHLTMIRTRQKLIGGERARYTKEDALRG